MAASGNIVTDILAKFSKKELTHKKELQLSQITLLIGVLPYYWRPKCKMYWSSCSTPMHSWYRDYLFLFLVLYFEERSHRCF
jgi:hypothetical protein